MERSPVNLRQSEEIRSVEPNNSILRQTGRGILNGIQSVRERMAGLQQQTSQTISQYQSGLRKAATVALAGGVAALAAADRATAGTINMDAPNLRAAQLMPGRDVHEQVTRGVSLLNNSVTLSARNADGSNDEMMYWLGIQRNSPEYVLDRYVDFGSDVPTQVTAPNNQSNDGVVSDFTLIRGDLNELQQYYFAYDVDQQGLEAGSLNNFLENSTVFAGFGPLDGDPQDINEAIAMTDGYVYYGNYPTQGLNLSDAYLLASYDVSGPPLVPGDYNGDGVNNGADFLAWQRQFGSSVDPYVGADGNGDGRIDAADYTVWRDNLGAGLDTGGNGGTTIGGQVPEPSSVALLALGAGGVGIASRRKKILETLSNRS